MKKLFVITIAIYFMSLGNLSAQTDGNNLQASKALTGVHNHVTKVQVGSYNFTKNNFAGSGLKSGRRFNEAQTALKDNNIEKAGHHLSKNTALALRTNFLENYSRRKPLISTALFDKTLGNAGPEVNAKTLKLKENKEGAGLFDCNVESDGINIALTKNACLNLDLGIDAEDITKEPANIEDIADSYADHSMGVSVGVLFGLR